MVELQCYSIHLPGQPGKNRGSTRRSGYVSWGSDAVYVTDSMWQTALSQLNEQR